MSNRDNSEYGYALAYKLACEQLLKIDNIEQQCDKCSARYQAADDKKSITLKYLNQWYLITLPDIEVSLVDSDEDIPIRDKILILHYVSKAKGTPNSNKIITYKELPEGNVYFPTFSKRTIKPLLSYFGNEPNLLVTAGENLGGRKADYGDVALTIDAFSHVPITLVLWQGDEELTPEGSIFFDANINDYLVTEDITVLCEIITWRLVRYLRSG